jgi:hypothetical protein
MMDDLLAQPLAHGIERPIAAVVDKRQHRDGVPCDERRADSAPGRAGFIAPLDERDIAAFWQLDQRGIGAALFTVVADELGSQPPRLHAHDRIGARVERVLLAEDLHADDILLQLGSASRRRFLHDEGEEALQTIALLKRLALEYALEVVVRRTRHRRLGRLDLLDDVQRGLAALGPGGHEPSSVHRRRSRLR